MFHSAWPTEFFFIFMLFIEFCGMAATYGILKRMPDDIASAHAVAFGILSVARNFWFNVLLPDGRQTRYCLN